MKAKEKAKELVDKMFKEIDSFYSGYYDVAKSQALIAVDEIINTKALGESPLLDLNIDNLYFWEEVKKEIKKL